MDRETVVLLHGFTGTPRVWDDVANQLSDDFEVLASPMLGHHGGPVLRNGETYTVERVADALERDLDAAQVQRPHLVGNSMGGWVALELASRGKAASVLGLAPAGFWNGADDPEQKRIRKTFARAKADASRTRPLLPVAFAVPPVRRFAFRAVAHRGDRLSRVAALEVIDGVLNCPAYPDLVTGPSRDGARCYDDITCPVAVRLFEHDRFFPPVPYAEHIAQRVPGAEVTSIDGVGHIPMIDDPSMVVSEVRAWVRRVGNTNPSPPG